MNVAALLIIVNFLVTSLAWADGPACAEFYDIVRARKIRFLDRNARQINDYLKDTVNSIESLRGRNGLVNDMAWVQSGQKIKIVNDNTSGTNIAVDLLIQVELLARQPNHKKALTNISNVLETLTKIERHPESGLFFSWYSTNDVTTVASRNLSSIDNLHLAIALWTIAESHPQLPVGIKAKELFDSIDMSMFFEPMSGFISGNFTYIGGQWIRDVYTFAYLGSEARILYTAGWSLGLFRQYKDQPQLMKKALNAIIAETQETAYGSLLKQWDGSAFQLLFPKMFVGEQNYSQPIKQMYSDFADYIVAEGAQRQLPLPAAHSPGVNRIVITPEMVYIHYNDKAGNRNLVSTFNGDINNPYYRENWDRTVTPYALVMAATAQPERFLPILQSAQSFMHEGQPLYIKGQGWLDGYNITGTSTDRIVPAQLAVNQGMIGIALLEMLSPDGMSASARAFMQNPEVNSKMKDLYKIIDQKLTTRKIK